jgi:hypothetical protein
VLREVETHSPAPFNNFLDLPSDTCYLKNTELNTYNVPLHSFGVRDYTLNIMYSTRMFNYFICLFYLNSHVPYYGGGGVKSEGGGVGGGSLISRESLHPTACYLPSRGCVVWCDPCKEYKYQPYALGSPAYTYK